MSFTIGSLFDGSVGWRPVKGYEAEYFVSNRGEVWSIRNNRLLTLKRTPAGYLRIALSVKGRRQDVCVHRLVAEAFIPNPEGKPTVNHINEVKDDNRVENLEWATFSEQNTHGTRTARAVANTDWKARSQKMDYAKIAQKHNYETMNAAQMRRVVQKDKGGNVIRVFDSIGQAARATNASTGHIWECCTGRRKSCKGSVWNYA